MSIEFFPYQTISTLSQSILSNIPSASIAYLLKLNQNCDLSDVGLSFIESRDFYTGHYMSLFASGTAGTIKSRTGWINVNNNSVTKDLNLPLGVTLHIAHTYAQGSQKTYLNGVQYNVGSLTGNIQATTNKFKLGGIDLTPNSGYSWKIDNLSIWHNYELTSQEVLFLRNGGSPSSIISPSYRGIWSLDGPIGSSVQLGDIGLVDASGQYNFVSITGSGFPKYAEQLVWEPSAFIENAYVGTCGETLFFSFITSSNIRAIPIQQYDPISIYKNGSFIGQSKDLWLTGSHRYIMYTFPSGESATTDDVISITTSGWILTNVGDVADVVNYTVDNKVGRSCFGTESINKTLPIGFNVGGPTDPGTINFVYKNLALRCSNYQGTTVDISGYPITTSITNCAAPIIAVNNSNGIDLTGTPGITGLVAISWDRTNNSAPTTFFLHSSDFSTTYIRCLERLDLYNPGNTGIYPGKTIGITRVYDIQLTSSSVYTPLNVYFTTTNNTPHFTNLSVQHQSDFTYTSGVPVVLDRSNKFAISNTFAERVRNAGTLRFMDCLVGNPIQTNIVEYEDAVGMDDFCFNSMSKRRWTVYYDHMKGFYPGNSPYIYSPVFGSSYPATLGDNINSSQTQFIVTDAGSAPVFYGLNLLIDNEILNVIDISGTLLTVTRGHSGTTPTSHNSGEISVGYRFPSSGVFNDSYCPIEFISASSHLLRTGFHIPFDGGNYPYLQYTNGTSGQIWTTNFHINSPVFVTSPSSYVVIHELASEVSGVYDITGNYSSCRVPYNFHLSANPCLPPGAAAAAVSQIDGADFHWVIPFAASNDFIIKAGRDVRDNLPPGRNVIIENGNEIWNYRAPNIYTRTISRHKGLSYVYGYNIQRTIEIQNILSKVFNEDGRNRGGEIQTTFNVQTVYGTVSPALSFALNNELRLDTICNAPYIGPYYQHATTTSGYTFCNTAQTLDLYIHDLYYGTDSNSFMGVITDHTNAINIYNSFGYNCKMISYEGDLERPIASFTPWSRQRTRDMMYHPNQIIINQDWFGLLQSVGYYRFNIFTLANYYYQGVYCWPYYAGVLQKPGIGDGSDGLFDNTKTIATPGLFYSKDSGVNQDANVVSTRGKSFLLWNAQIRNNPGRIGVMLNNLPQSIFRNIFLRGV